MLLLRKTKKFIQKTLNSLKSLCSSSDHHYLRMPKTTTPPHMNVQTTYNDHITNPWDLLSSANNNKEIKPIGKRLLSNKKNAMKQENSLKDVHPNGNFKKFAAKAMSQSENVNTDSRFIAAAVNVKRSEERRSLLITEMLKELELMDKNNVDHVLDIEEFRHYYYRLTCPAYVDIVDKFFFEICAEFFGHTAVPARVSSRPKLRS